MRKIIMHRTGGPEVLELIEAPAPQAAPGHVVVEAEAIGVGWPDILIRRGIYRWMPPLPTSPGSDLAGHVIDVGEGVDSALIGSPVLVTARELPVRGGCYAEQIAVPVDALFRLPTHVALDAAVCLPNYQVAWNLLHEAPRGQPVQSVFIRGIAGGVGSALAQLAKSAGMKVFGSVSSEQKAAFAHQIGADHTINYTTENVADRVLALTGGQGVDLAVDHIGGPDLPDLLRMLGRWGLLVSYNASGGMPEKNLLAALRENGVRCPAVRIFEMHVYDDDRVNRRRTMQSVIDLLASGEIKPMISDRLELADAGRAHAMVEAGHGLGKVVLMPSLDRGKA
ncbi:MAG: zinc-dependent alcohol dehydrogenase family protein [Hyphomicrobium sp.]|nr:zinc-dependent alcohol dehydrogenase family protein [Hyphomicrobium sp.]